MKNLQMYLIFALRKILKFVFVKRQVLVIILFFSGSMFVNAQPTESNSEIMQEDSLDGQWKDKSQSQGRMIRDDIYFFRVGGKLVFTKDKYACLKSQKKTLRRISTFNSPDME
jgi:hypothetical protein